jgi:hypothetical protein
MSIEVGGPKGNTQAITDIVDISTYFLRRNFLGIVAEQTAVLNNIKI